MFTKIFKRILAIFLMSCLGITYAEIHQTGCAIESAKHASLRLIEVRTEVIDGRMTDVGKFEVTAYGKHHFTLTGWQRDFGFLIETPDASVQLHQKDWKDASLFIGSFDSSGASKLQVNSDASQQVLIRISEGLPAGSHKIRVIVSTIDGRCILSKPFIHEVR
jgi:hypothetical protein